MSLLKSALFACAVCSFSLAQAASDQEVNQQATSQTQDLLRDSSQRDKAVQENASTRAADQQAAQVAGSKANKDEIYSISADIMPSLVQKTNGDPKKMQEILDRAKADPEGFAKTLSP